MSKWIWVLTGPVNALILYAIFKDAKECWNDYIKLKNLRKNLLNEVLEINLSRKEVEMLDDLSKGNRNRYLRKKIMEVVKDAYIK